MEIILALGVCILIMWALKKLVLVAQGVSKACYTARDLTNEYIENARKKNTKIRKADKVRVQGPSPEELITTIQGVKQNEHNYLIAVRSEIDQLEQDINSHK